MTPEERFWFLLSRHLAGEASVQDEEELRSLLDSSEELHIRYEGISTYWGKSQQRTEINVEKLYQRVLDNIDRAPVASKSLHRYIVWGLRVAAMLLVASGVSWYFYPSDVKEPLWVSLMWEAKETLKGERTKMTLPDGSIVWLNADSRIQYPAEFENGSREIYLSGEAFFDVAKNPNKPFIIHLANGDIRVLGTSFNVRAFEDEPNVETSVLTGKVAFIAAPSASNQQRDTVKLTPNYKVVLTKISGKITKEHTNSAEDKSWTEGRMIFKSQPFGDVAKVLERNFGKTIVFKDETIKNCRLTGTFENNSLDEVMRLFAKTKDYTYTISENELVISGSGCSAE